MTKEQTMRSGKILVAIAAATVATAWPSAALASAAPTAAHLQAKKPVTVTGSYTWNILFAGGGGGFGEVMTLAAEGSGTMFSGTDACQLDWAVSGKEIAITTSGCDNGVTTLIGTVNKTGFCSQAKPGQAALLGSNGQGGTVEDIATWYAIRS